MNVTALVDTSGNVVERYEYTPYGEVTVLDGNVAGDGDNTGSPDTEWSADPDGRSDVDNEVLFAGYRYDAESGLYHVRFRMYHPTLGRWVQRDPLGYVDGMGLYGAYFVPGATDPSGLGRVKRERTGTYNPPRRAKRTSVQERPGPNGCAIVKFKGTLAHTSRQGGKRAKSRTSRIDYLYEFRYKCGDDGSVIVDTWENSDYDHWNNIEVYKGIGLALIGGGSISYKEIIDYTRGFRSLSCAEGKVGNRERVTVAARWYRDNRLGASVGLGPLSVGIGGWTVKVHERKTVNLEFVIDCCCDPAEGEDESGAGEENANENEGNQSD